MDNTPFSHLPEFKSAPPEVQAKVVEKFNSLSPEDKQTVMGKINTPMQLRGDTGMKDVSLTPLTKGEFQKTGEDVSAKMMTKGMVNANIDPYLAATVGTTIAMIPHVAAALIGPKGAKTVEEGGSAAGETVGKIADASSEKLGGILDAIKGTGQKQVASLTEKAAELPLNQAAKSQMAQGMRTAAKTGIQAAEEKVQLGLTNIQGKPELLSDAFAVKAAKLADMGPEKLSTAMDSNTLQTMRKTADLGYKQGGANAPLYAKAKKAFTDALGLQQPDIKDALSKYQDIEKVIADLPAQFKTEKQTLTLALTKARNLAKSQAPIRKAAGIAASGGAAALGYGAVKKALQD